VNLCGFRRRGTMEGTMGTIICGPRQGSFDQRRSATPFAEGAYRRSPPVQCPKPSSGLACPIFRIIPRGCDLPFGVPGPSDRRDADFHGVVNFALSEFYEVRKDHSFGVCAAVPLGNTIRSLLSRAPLMPLRGTAWLFSCLRPARVRLPDVQRRAYRDVSYIRLR
jgi:hypothetical protein